ncbi:hypothetical protein F2Q69_00037446 [Brassica cretica]|uniref:Uncharacterized protein n=1 Tax=Brassica cretica TaxID=69181 RepID=A0A8S9SG86_BRACR|nr:hypothetical protein F2Q69_00037446 [Brassica cretica]
MKWQQEEQLISKSASELEHTVAAKSSPQLGLNPVVFGILDDQYLMIRIDRFNKKRRRRTREQADKHRNATAWRDPEAPSTKRAISPKPRTESRRGRGSRRIYFRNPDLTTTPKRRNLTFSPPPRFSGVPRETAPDLVPWWHKPLELREGKNEEGGKGEAKKEEKKQRGRGGQEPRRPPAAQQDL